MDKLKYHGSSNGYQWGSHHWHMTTWNKVHLIKAVYELGFHVIHSDTDVTWFRDPMPYFSKYKNGPVDAIFATDALETQNKEGDEGLEAMTSPYININTGVYFVRQWDKGVQFFEKWLSLQDKNIGHDQDGLNTLVRGVNHRGEKQQGFPKQDQARRLVECAQVPGAFVSFLPVSMFGNAYTYVTGRVHEKVKHPLYEVHWVWSGSTMESKQQTMRDAMKFWDPMEYYTTPNVITMDLWVPQPFSDYNDVKFDDTEKMILFHIYAANAQLRQVYYGFIAALALNRVIVIPKFQCYCAKNWYMTQSCHINGEPHTTFPYDCALSHMLRVKRLLHGLQVSHGTKKTSMLTIREHSFLDHPNIPKEMKASRLVLVPADKPRDQGDTGPISPGALRSLEVQPDGSSKLVVPWPLDDEDLQIVLKPYVDTFRIIHFSNATKIMGRGFHDAVLHQKFDEAVKKMTTHWCCRSPRDQERFNATDKVDLRILPKERDPQADNYVVMYGVKPGMGGYEQVT